MVVTALSVNAQTISVSGTVTDNEGEPVIGASVMVVGTTTGAATDIDGKYLLKNVPSNGKLRFSYVGCTTQEVAVKGQTTIDVVLAQESTMLDEVVAIGYATVRRRDLTAATTSVGGKELLDIPVTTAAQALTGKAAGVNVVTQSGAPGADINITVRGGTSITQSSEPLYIVDGFQMENGLQNVDINDIETIDVMKDASATAIYGSAGANGVIIITTKSGQAGKSQISYNGYVSFTRLGKKLNLLNTEEYVKYQYEFQNLRGNLGAFTTIFGGDINAPGFYENVYSDIERDYRNREGIDWQDEVFGHTGVTQNHNVSITGGNDKTNFMVSYNYTGEDGIMKKHNYEKNSVRAKLRHQLFKNVRFDFAVSLQSTKVEGGGSMGGTLKETILQPITGGVLWTNEQMIKTDLSDDYTSLPGGSEYDSNNPLLSNKAIDNEKYTRLATVNAGLEIDIIKGLTFRTAGSYMWRQTRQDYWDNGTTKQAAANKSPYGYGYRNNAENSNWQITNTLNYHFDINKVHDFNVLLGQETSYWNSMYLNNEYREFPDGNFGLNDVSMATPYTWTSSKDKVGLVSVFGRLSYSYDNRYIINATIRGDGSSKFAKGNKWDSFPSVSAAWRISQEKFMESTRDYLNSLKLRVGYGVAGNNKIDSNMYATSYGSGHYGNGSSDFITFVPGSTLGNPALVWEKTKTVNVGLDMSWFNSRLNLTLDWYNNQSENLLIKNKIPSSTGYTDQYQNIGSIRNRGLEVVLNAMPVVTRDFTWTTDFNISFNRSKVLSIYGGKGDESFTRDYDGGKGAQATFLIEKGKPLGQFYGLIYDGIYTTDDFDQLPDGGYMLKAGVPSLKGLAREKVKPGDAKYKPIKGETDNAGNPVWSVNDRTVIGHAQPKFTGGWTNTFMYKGFDLSIFLNFSYGNDVVNVSTSRFIGPYLPNQNNMKSMANRFVLIDPATGRESTNLARLAELNPNQYDEGTMWNISENNKTAMTDRSSFFVEDASFLRINNITLGYTLPTSLTKKAYISKLRVYATANNIHTFTNYSGYEPEVAVSGSALTPGVDYSAYPRAKSWVVGLNITF
ncbi:MAG: TonB-dependent receptor [Muribaculaceae bacterium]|nr:TonB-dependent receptor [Muribaculaceae bacterium]